MNDYIDLYDYRGIVDRVGPELVEPSASLTLPEMINNFRHGLPVNARVFDDLGLGTDDDDDDGTDVDYIDIASLDLAEAEALSRELGNHINNLKSNRNEPDGNTSEIGESGKSISTPESVEQKGV